MREALVSSLTLMAHAFGQTYNLPVPLWLFMFGGAATVIVSFILASLLVDVKRARVSYPKRMYRTIPSIAVKVSLWVATATYLIVIAGGIVGSQSFISNISPTLFWVLLLIALAHVSILAGNIWQFINPFSRILDVIEVLVGKKIEPRFVYPRQLRYVPALAVYFWFVWLELLSYGWGVVPLNLSVILLVYGVATIVGATAYGREAWFRYGDFFSVFFGLFSKVAPFEYVENKIYLRQPVVSLLSKANLSPIFLFFVLFMLSSTAFDGLRETAAYLSISQFITSLPLFSGLDSHLLDTMILLISPFIFFAVYWVCIVAMKHLVRSSYSVMYLAKQFILTLVPIAIAYNVAHYFTVTLIQGQLLIKLISDPFGLGWNLFHTANYTINAGIIDAASVWYIQVALIIAGHIAAIYLAHLVALKTFVGTKQVLLSQYPMLALMVVYTMTSLWIISQSIIAAT